MRKLILLILFVYQVNNVFSQSPTCIMATPFCTSSSITYPASTNTIAQTGPDYACLSTQPNPAWFYFKFATAGNLDITITNSLNQDIDFICWGPFTSPLAACDSLSALHVIDCSYSTAPVENANINVAQAGDYYIMMITNFSGQLTDITFSVTGGVGTISCDEVCVTHGFYDAPLCVGGSLQLLATDHLGLGNYSWTGPNGFTSTQKDPVINGVGLSESGVYYVNYFQDTSCFYNDSVSVYIDTCGTLSGRVYSDANSNCSYDSTENYIANAQIKLTQSGSFVAYAWTDPYGFYYFDVPVGTYTIELMSATGYSITCSGSMAHSTTITNSLTTENFAVTCDGLDLAVSGVNVWYGFFPGTSNPVFPLLGNYFPTCSDDSLSVTVTVIVDSLVQYNGPFSYGAGPDTIITAGTGDTLIWNISDLNSNFGFFNSAFTVLTNTSATIGDTVCFTVIVSVVQGDSDTTNNVYTECFAVGNSYDPNSKEVTPRGLGVSGFIPDTTQRLEYLVHFQNMGTAPAHNIYILDTLDSDLDVSSLEIISSSHAQTTTLLPGNVLKFNFANIMLADSAHDEPNSHGYVKYSIGLNPALSPGTPIENTAYIFFDYNPPVVTNTALNTIEFPLGVKEFSDASLSVFPNPANNTINVQFVQKKAENVHLKLMNITGQTMIEEKATAISGKYSKTLDITGMAKGMYLLQIITERGTIQQKVVKE